jgi:hypothetical protein
MLFLEFKAVPRLTGHGTALFDQEYTTHAEKDQVFGEFLLNFSGRREPSKTAPPAPGPFPEEDRLPGQPALPTTPAASFFGRHFRVLR